MKKIIECVPNFSEGRDKEKIEAIITAIRHTDGCTLLDVDPGPDTNRTVVTFVGEPQAVVDGAFNAMKVACDVIDMRIHKGEHKRMGATDVVPFIPVADVEMSDCIACARQLGERAARDLGVPMYLYGEAATRPDRIKLPDVRSGEYEGLSEKIKKPEFRPDFGEPVFNEKSGATATGARNFLIAWNINVKNPDKRNAHAVALNMREIGRIAKDEQGNKKLGSDGKVVRIPGKFRHLQAMGFDLPDRGISQISCNILDYRQTPLHEVFEACKSELEILGEIVTGSELIGVVPKAALIDAGRFYCMNEESEEILVKTAIERLGLSDLSPFDPDRKIIEYMI